MKEDTVQYAYNKDNNNESLYVLVNGTQYVLTKWFNICGIPVLTYPNNFPQKINNILHPHDTVCVLPATSNHPIPMIMFNGRFLENKNFSSYNVLAIILHEVGHIAGEKQTSSNEMEREFGADEYAASMIGRDCMLETIDKDLLNLTTIPQSVRRDNRIRRLEQKKQYLMSLTNLPSGTNQKLLFEVFPNQHECDIFVARVSEYSVGASNLSSNKLK